MAASADSSELRRFARDLGAVPANVAPKVRAVVAKGALNVKNQQRREMETSKTFRKLASTINYDLFTFKSRVEAEIGPNRHHRRAWLANIAYFEAERGEARAAVFGSSTGGGVVPDPSLALDDEMPRLLDALADVTGKILPR